MTYLDDGPDEDWVEDEGGDDEELLACPSCGQSVHEDTQQCPYCGDWITPVYPRSRVARWFVPAVVVIMIFLILFIAIF